MTVEYNGNGIENSIYLDADDIKTLRICSVLNSKHETQNNDSISDKESALKLHKKIASNWYNKKLNNNTSELSSMFNYNENYFNNLNYLRNLYQQKMKDIPQKKMQDILLFLGIGLNHSDMNFHDDLIYNYFDKGNNIYQGSSLTNVVNPGSYHSIHMTYNDFHIQSQAMVDLFLKKSLNFETEATCSENEVMPIALPKASFNHQSRNLTPVIQKEHIDKNSLLPSRCCALESLSFSSDPYRDRNVDDDREPRLSPLKHHSFSDQSINEDSSVTREDSITSQNKYELYNAIPCTSGVKVSYDNKNISFNEEEVQNIVELMMNRLGDDTMNEMLQDDNGAFSSVVQQLLEEGYRDENDKYHNPYLTAGLNSVDTNDTGEIKRAIMEKYHIHKKSIEEEELGKLRVSELISPKNQRRLPRVSLNNDSLTSDTDKIKRPSSQKRTKSIKTHIINSVPKGTETTNKKLKFSSHSQKWIDQSVDNDIGSLLIQRSSNEPPFPAERETLIKKKKKTNKNSKNNHFQPLVEKSQVAVTTSAAPEVRNYKNNQVTFFRSYLPKPQMSN